MDGFGMPNDESGRPKALEMSGEFLAFDKILRMLS
jgi:hypothetical protein